MEYLIDLHGEGYLYYGGRPADIGECCRKSSLRLGMSAQLSAKDRRGGLKISSRGLANAVRQNRPQVILSDLLNWRYEATGLRDDLAVISEFSGERLLSNDQMTLRIMVGTLFNCFSSLLSDARMSPGTAVLARLAIKTEEIVRSVATKEDSIGLDMVRENLATHSDMVRKAKPDDNGNKSGTNSANATVSTDELK
ncbi:hypothetical protein BST61_g605 [Cercospora zeina]